MTIDDQWSFLNILLTMKVESMHC